MANLRIIFSNVADQSTLTASTTAGSLSAGNLLKDNKLQVHRSVGTSVTYTLTWASSQQIGGVALPATNLTKTATIRVRLFSDTAGLNLVADSQVVQACPTSSVGLHSWGAPINVNAFAFGGASKAAVWFASQPANIRRCEITLQDPDNAAGYIDCSRVVCGPFWEAERNPSYGATLGVTDMTKSQRADSGDLLVVRGAQYETMSFDLADMSESARAQLAKIFRSAGAHRNLFFSAVPDYPREAPGLSEPRPLAMSGQNVQQNGADVGMQEQITVTQEASLEQDLMIYGRRSSAPFKFDFFNSFSTRVEIEGW